MLCLCSILTVPSGGYFKHAALLQRDCLLYQKQFCSGYIDGVISKGGAGGITGILFSIPN